MKTNHIYVYFLAAIVLSFSLLHCSEDKPKTYTIISSLEGQKNELGIEAVVTTLNADTATIKDLNTLAEKLKSENWLHQSTQYYVYLGGAPDLTKENFTSITDAARFCKDKGAIAEIFILKKDVIHACPIKNGMLQCE